MLTNIDVRCKCDEEKLVEVYPIRYGDMLEQFIKIQISSIE